MRKAAGIILIILGVFQVVLIIFDLSGVADSGLPASSLLPGIWAIAYGKIVWGGLLLAGGVFCLRRSYWGLCLVSTFLPLLTDINQVVLTYLTGHSYVPWRNWILLSGALMATIFICLRKGEWAKSQPEPDPPTPR